MAVAGGVQDGMPLRPSRAVEVTTIGRDGLPAISGAVARLLARALEPNVLHGPDVLDAALEAFAPNAQIFVARLGGAEGEIIGLLPLWRPRIGFGLTARWPAVFGNDFTPLSTPLVDREHAVEALAALLRAVSERNAGMVLPYLMLSGPFALALADAVRLTGFHLRVAEFHERAALMPGRDPLADEAAQRFNAGLRRKRRREWARQWRRLVETGPVTMRSVRGGEAEEAFADFLVLEASGWKGRNGTALVQHPRELRFGERIVSALAKADGVVIDRIDRSGQPIAMLVNFGVAGHYVTWKTAYDEAFSTFSPGAQVFLRASARFLSEPAVLLVDSLAVADHPLLSHMWRDSCAIGTVLVGFGGSTRISVAETEVAAYHGLRRFAKAMRDRWLR